MGDLTIIFLTLNRLPEKWVKFHREKLLESIGNTPVITLSSKPTNLGLNIIQDRPPSKPNIFRQMLRGAIMAKTPYIAIVEDDTLYPKDHFTFFRPPLDRFAYNQHRWSLYTWGEPIYHLKNYMLINSSLIAPRELLIKNLEERFKKLDDNSPVLGDEIGVIEKKLGLPRIKPIEAKSENPIIQFDHDFFTRGSEKETIERRHAKKLGVIKAYDVPYWGSAKNLVKKFYE